MTTVRIYLAGERFGPQFERSTKKAGDMVRKAARGAANHAAIEIEQRGREDIEAAGNFGSRWTDGLHAKVTEGGGNIRINVTMEVPYWSVFEYGAEIHPVHGDYLWFTPTAGYPLLRQGESKTGKPLFYNSDNLPEVIRVKEVHIPKKFHLGQIIAEVAKELRSYYSEMMKAP